MIVQVIWIRVRRVTEILKIFFLIQSITGNYKSVFLLKLYFDTLLDSEFTEENKVVQRKFLVLRLADYKVEMAE